MTFFETSTTEEFAAHSRKMAQFRRLREQGDIAGAATVASQADAIEEGVEERLLAEQQEQDEAAKIAADRQALQAARDENDSLRARLKARDEATRLDRQSSRHRPE